MWATSPCTVKLSSISALLVNAAAAGAQSCCCHWRARAALFVCVARCWKWRRGETNATIKDFKN